MSIHENDDAMVALEITREAVNAAIIGMREYTQQVGAYNWELAVKTRNMDAIKSYAAAAGVDIVAWEGWANTLWRPDSDRVPSVQAWYKPDALSLGTLTTWEDSSPNGSDANTRGDPPTVIDDGLTGYPSVEFSALGQDLETGIVDRLHGQNATIYVAFKWPIPEGADYPANSTMIGQISGDGRTPYITFFNGTFYMDVGAAAVVGEGRFAIGNSQFKGPDYHMVAIQRTELTIEVWHNGVSIATGVLDGAIPLDKDNVRIGESVITIAEMWIGNAADDVDTRQKHEGYLAHKFGLEGNLPDGHPYKSAAP